jgi:hypothetical protein
VRRIVGRTALLVRRCCRRRTHLASSTSTAARGAARGRGGGWSRNPESPSRIDTLIKTLAAELKEIRRLARAARPRSD